MSESNTGEPYNGTPFGWAFRTGSGCWYWSQGTVGLTREDAAERAVTYRRGPEEPAQVARVWIDIPPGDSPIDALAIIEHAEEMYGDNIPEVIVPEDGPIIICDKDDVADLQSALDAVWNAWIAKHGTEAAFVADDEAEDVAHTRVTKCSLPQERTVPVSSPDLRTWAAAETRVERDTPEGAEP